VLKWLGSSRHGSCSTGGAFTCACPCPNPTLLRCAPRCPPAASTHPPPTAPCLPCSAPPLQLAEAEQQYAEIYDEYEKAREFYASVEALTANAQQDYLRDKRQWQEASEADARTIADLQRQLAAERAGRDAAEAQLATAQVCGERGGSGGLEADWEWHPPFPAVGVLTACQGTDSGPAPSCLLPLLLQDQVRQLEADLAAAREAQATAQREREAALAAESAALQQAAAAVAAQEAAEERSTQHAEGQERAEKEAAKARVDAQR
jgi:hypothetical protein